MVDMTSYEPGTPTWVDLGSPDIEASATFYGGLFGWEAPEQGPEAGGYRMFTLRGKPVAGLGPLMGEGQPPSWTTYVSVADVDATLRLAEENGGKPVMPGLDVLDAGRMAILSDSAGAVLALWQPGRHVGAEIVNEAGAYCWSELLTRDVEGAKAFYGAVFGWTPKVSEIPDMTYTEWQLGDRSVGGMAEIGEDLPAETPPHWAVYFGTPDVDEAAATVERLGGTVLVPPADVEGVGRFAAVADPHGAPFSLFRM